MEAILCKSFPLHKLACKELSCKQIFEPTANSRADIFYTFDNILSKFTNSFYKS